MSRHLLSITWYTLLALYVASAALQELVALAVNVVSVDTTSSQTISNKTFDDTNQHQLLKYNSRLRIQDISKPSANFAVNTHREHLVTTGSSDKTGTLPAATGSGDTYDVCKWDSSAGHVVINRAGTDVIKSAAGISATSRTLSKFGDCDTIQDADSGQWLARGNGG